MLPEYKQSYDSTTKTAVVAFFLTFFYCAAVSKEFLLNLLLLLSVNILIKPLYAFGVDMQVQAAVGNVFGDHLAQLDPSRFRNSNFTSTGRNTASD